MAWNSVSIRSEYSPRFLRVPAESPSSRSSARRLLKPMKSARKAVHRKSQALVLTWMATEPATTRHTKPLARNITSRITRCLKYQEYEKVVIR